MDAIELAARYSFIPNRLKYCGPEDADKVFFDYIITKKNKERVKELLHDFKALRLYLELIAKNNNKQPFDKEVVEAYWIGNSLLDNVNNQEIRSLILNEFTKQGLPKTTAQELADNTPVGITPHHSFHVLHVNFITKKVDPHITNLDKCRISWGIVKKVEDTHLLIEYKPVISADGKTVLGKPKEKRVNYLKEFFDSIKEGDAVSVHWDLAIEKLNNERLANIERYTLKNIGVMNDPTP